MDNQYQIDRQCRGPRPTPASPAPTPRTGPSRRAWAPSPTALWSASAPPTGRSSTPAAPHGGVKTVQDGGDPPGVAPTCSTSSPTSGVQPKDVFWYDATKDKLQRPEEEDKLLVQVNL